MRKAVILGLAFLLAAAAGAALAEGQVAGTETKPVTWDNWLAAKATAEKYDKEGKFVEALQYYLEYTRLAQELGSPMHRCLGEEQRGVHDHQEAQARRHGGPGAREEAAGGGAGHRPGDRGMQDAPGNEPGVRESLPEEMTGRAI